MTEINFSFLNASMPIVERHLDTNQVVVSISALVVILLFISVKLLFKGYFSHLFVNVFRTDVSASKLIESNSAGTQASIITTVASTISIGSAIMSILVFNTTTVYSNTIKPLVLLLILIAGVSAFLLFYKIALWVLGWIFEISEIAATYSDMISDIFKVAGIIIFPSFLIMPFADIWMYNILSYCTLAFLSIAIIIKLYGFFRILTKIKFFNHYAILYFCIFEILPILLIVKIAGYL